MFKKRIVALLLALMLVAVAFAGCAASPSGTSDKPEYVTLGFFGPITGSGAAEGSAARNAFQLAIDQANASGEYPYEIRTIIIDDQGDPTAAASGAQQVVADSTVVAATGHWHSVCADATTPVFIENEIPFLIWGAIRENLTNADNYPWITRSAPTDVQENNPLAVKVLDEMGYKKIFIVSTDSSYGNGNLNAFKAELAKRGLEPVGVESVPAETVDFNAIVTKIMASDCDAVYCGSTNTEGIYLKEQLSKAGFNKLFFGISGLKTEDFLIIGADAAEGAFVTSPGIRLDSTEAGKKFIADYNAQNFDTPIGAYTPYSYEAALILLQALKACGDNPTPLAMRDAIANGSFSGIMGTTTFNDIGQTELVAVCMYVVQDGQWVYFEDSDYASGARSFGK
ncbi:MAG: branched-chain amino acid ABC transporter substrate-binding protein [Clostridiaceae bacterium]|nr:branched-chain amino acid ABC transporter substrate-binding protein [Eubacteriales bacterium]